MNLFEILIELKKYSSPNCKLYPGCNKENIIEFERKLKYILPSDFKEFLYTTNGAIINCHEIYGIKNGIPALDLFDNYLFETKEAGNPMPDYYLPIYPDGMGNHNCLDLKNLSTDRKTCNVIFWQHDRLYSVNEPPELDADSFTRFLENLLKDMLDNYNYDGTEKK